MRTAESFPMLDLRGTDHQMGVERGRRQRGEIRRSLAVRLGALCQLLPLTPNHALALAERKAEACRAACPSAAEEVEGLADGAGLSGREAWFLQAWETLAGIERYGTCCLACGAEASRSGQVLVGLNRDAAPWLVEPMAVVRRVPRHGPPSLQMLHHGEVAGCGLNAAGVLCFDLGGGGQATGPALPAGWLCRAALDAESGEAAASRLAPLCADSGQSVLLGDANEGRLACLAASKGRTRTAYSGAGLFARALTPRAGGVCSDDEGAEVEAERSRMRERRMLLLADQHRGGMEAGTVAGILSDHQNYPAHSVCRHNAGPNRLSTLASVVAEPGEGFLSVCLGPPCSGDYQTVDL